jgi:hypothetical protein
MDGKRSFYKPAVRSEEPIPHRRYDSKYICQRQYFAEPSGRAKKMSNKCSDMYLHPIITQHTDLTAVDENNSVCSGKAEAGEEDHNCPNLIQVNNPISGGGSKVN